MVCEWGMSERLGPRVSAQTKSTSFRARKSPSTARLLESFFQSSNDYIAISGRGRALKASGSRASLDCEWQSMFDFNLMKITASPGGHRTRCSMWRRHGVSI